MSPGSHREKARGIQKSGAGVSYDDGPRAADYNSSGAETFSESERISLGDDAACQRNYRIVRYSRGRQRCYAVLDLARGIRAGRRSAR